MEPDITPAPQVGPEVGQALLELTALTPRFFDQRIQFSHEDETNRYFMVGVQHEHTHVKFYVHVGLPLGQTDWTGLVPVLAEEFNKIEITKS
jgi:hypothetical protein